MIAGTIVGAHRIGALLGQGRSGAVWSAEHRLLQRPAAVKVFTARAWENYAAVREGFREAREASALRQPGIVEIHDFGFHSDGGAFLVMELLAGESLAARMRRGPMPAPVVQTIGAQAAAALVAAHAHGLAHRGLQAGCIFLVPDAAAPGRVRVKLLDFGMVTLAASAAARPRDLAADQAADRAALGRILAAIAIDAPPPAAEAWVATAPASTSRPARPRRDRGLGAAAIALAIGAAWIGLASPWHARASIASAAGGTGAGSSAAGGTGAGPSAAGGIGAGSIAPAR